MQYKVPQDVQREDTIIGPITIRQLIILGIGGGITYAIYVSLAKTYFLEVWLLPVIFTGSLTLAFAFLKIHSLEFHEFLMNFIEYHMLPRNRFWIQGTGYAFVPPFEEKKDKKAVTKQKTETKPQKSLSELTKVLDTHGGSEIEPIQTTEELAELSKQEKKAALDSLITQNYNQ